MIQLNGRPAVGFGDIVDRLERSQDPLYECHHDQYVRLKILGTAVVSSAVTAGVLYLIRK
jgi:hypothetical protein